MQVAVSNGDVRDCKMEQLRSIGLSKKGNTAWQFLALREDNAFIVVIGLLGERWKKRGVVNLLGCVHSRSFAYFMVDVMKLVLSR